MTQQSLITRLKAVEEALTYRKRKETEWAKVLRTPCPCDHNEYCSICYPLDFRTGGKFSFDPIDVERAALSDLRELIKEAEGQEAYALAKGQVWHVMRPGATACCTLEIVEVTKSTVLFRSPGYCNEERLPINDVRFVELLATPQPPATTDKENVE